MSQYFEVVGDVMGDVMGDDEVVGAGPPAGSWRHGSPQQRAMAPRPGHRILVQRPSWRDGQLAPGVMAPDEGMVPLGMIPNINSGVFAAAPIPTTITWIGRLQKPYRAERLLVSSVRTGATATGRLLGQFFVGVDLNMATTAGVDIELFGASTAFGTRLTLLQAPPGVEISVPVTISTQPTSTDTVFATIQWAGRIVH